MSYFGTTLRLLTVALAFSGPPAHGEGAHALPSVVGASELYQNDRTSGLALGGLDPVTYFLPEGPRVGRAELELTWSGVVWRFASAANRTAFESDPAGYAPRMGGYDAQAASQGKIVDANPAIYLVSSQRLYLFRTDASRARFLADEGVAARGEVRWSDLKRSLVAP